MKWNELQHRAQIKLTCDLRVVPQAVMTTGMVTPEELDRIMPIAHKGGSVFTVYQEEVPEGWPIQTELFNEATDDMILMDSSADIPAHFQLI